jgi:hypothetical protein
VIGAITNTSPLLANGVTYTVLPSTQRIIADQDDDGRGPQVGMIARLQGAIGAGNLTGTATSLEINAELRGPIQNVDAAGATLTILGIAVQLNAQTIIEYQPAGVDPRPLAIGDQVQVHGYPDGRNRILATRLIKRVDSSVFKATGVVSYANCPNCQTFGRAFRLGTVLVSVPENIPLNGLSWPIPETTLVRVWFAAPSTQGSGTATAIAPYSGGPLLLDAITKMRGFVQAGAASKFYVNGIEIAVQPSTVFSGGAETQLRDGQFVEVEGLYRSSSVQAKSIQFLP